MVKLTPNADEFFVTIPIRVYVQDNLWSNASLDTTVIPWESITGPIGLTYGTMVAPKNSWREP